MTATNAAGMPKRPKVLVLMAAFNGQAWIEAQLASVFAQRDVDVRVHVSDDRSSDGTPALLRALAARHPGLEVVPRERPSGSAGANFRAMLASVDFGDADHVALCDQDDVWLPEHLARGCAALAASGAAGYSCAVQTFGDDKPAVLRQATRARRLDFLFEGGGQGCTFVLRRDLAQRVQRLCREHAGLVDGLHYHDWLIYLCARVGGDRWVFDPHPTLQYRQHGTNEIGARSGGGAIARRLALIREGWLARQVAGALALASVLAPGDATLQRFATVFRAPSSAARRWRLAWLLAWFSRRRRIDSAILCAAALLGWL